MPQLTVSAAAIHGGDPQYLIIWVSVSNENGPVKGLTADNFRVHIADTPLWSDPGSAPAAEIYPGFYQIEISLEQRQSGLLPPYLLGIAVEAYPYLYGQTVTKVSADQ